MRYIVLQGQTTGSRQKTVLSGFCCASRLTRLISVPTAHDVPAGASLMVLDDLLGGAVEVGGLDDFPAALGVDDDVHAGEIGAGLLDLVDAEALVGAAVALPEDDLRVAELLRR